MLKEEEREIPRLTL